MDLKKFGASLGARLKEGSKQAGAGALQQVIADHFDGLVVVDDREEVIAASTTACALLERPTLIGLNAARVLPIEMLRAMRQAMGSGSMHASSSLAVAVLRNGGENEERLIVQYVVTLSRAESGPIACINFWDVTERRRAEEKLSFLATHDPLTGALSRTGFCGELNQRFEGVRGRNEGLSVIAIDLSRFKAVNDALGHAHGDMLLKQVVSRLRATGAAYVARLGGHEFVIGHPGLTTDETAQFCDLLEQRLIEPYRLGPHRAIIGADIGYSHTGVSGYDPETLLSHADMALSVSRTATGKGYIAFSPEMDEELRESQQLETAMQQAMERGEISLMFQPQASLDDGRIIGVEALMRWAHSEMGPISPERFIPVAEETGKIVELGRWILAAACREVASWPGDLRLSVNVSPVQFELVDVVGEIRDALGRTGLPANRLDVEITEGIFMSNTRKVTDILQKLRHLGIGIALDDFGTGYSSLSYLGRLPVDKIKIDQSFVKRLPGDQEAGVIIRAVMMLSEALNKVVIAEGIETADQAWMLKMMGCKVGQGYHYGRPKTAAEMRVLLAEQAVHPIRAVV